MEPSYQDIIEQYLAGDLSAQEVSKLEAELKTNSVLQEELSLQQSMINLLKAQEKDQISKDLHRLWDTNKQPTAPTQKTAKTVTLAPWKKFAAAAVLMLVGYVIFQLMRPSVSAENLLTAHLQEQPAYTILRSSPITDSLEHKAGHAYQSKDYKKSALYFEKLSIKEPTKIYHTYYHGLSLLFQNPPSTEKGLQLLDKVVANNDPLYKEQAAWYSALGELKLNNIEKAKQLLEGIVQRKAWKSQEAKELLSKL